MNPIPLNTLILQGIPEGIAATLLAFCIANIPLKWGKIILIGVIMALSAYILRRFPIAPGIHSIFLFIIQFLFLVILTKANIFMSFLGSIMSFLALIILETGSVIVFTELMGITPDILMSDSIARTLMFEPQVILLFLTAYLVKKYRKKFFKEEASESYEYQ